MAATTEPIRALFRQSETPAMGLRTTQPGERGRDSPGLLHSVPCKLKLLVTGLVCVGIGMLVLVAGR